MTVLTEAIRDIKFKDYPSERLIIKSISSRLTWEEQVLRLHLLDQIIEKGAPVAISSLKQSKVLPHLNTDSLIRSMVDKQAVVPDQKGNINFAYPVSALTTNHKVALKDGRNFHAMCAVDAMGAAFTFRQDVRVDSVCSQCGQKISLVIEDGKIVDLHPEGTHVMHVDLNNADNWAGSC